MNLCKLVSEVVLYLCTAYGARVCLGDTDVEVQRPRNLIIYSLVAIRLVCELLGLFGVPRVFTIPLNQRASLLILGGLCNSHTTIDHVLSGQLELNSKQALNTNTVFFVVLI